MIRLNTIHHVAIIVSDYQKSRDFYVNKLALKLSGRITGNRGAIINWI